MKKEERFDVSFSRIDTFRQCRLMFVWRYVLDIPAPPSKSQETGTQLHLIAENYLKTGVLPKGDDRPTRLVLDAIARLPEYPQPRMFKIERWVEYPMGDLCNYRGAIDAYAMVGDRRVILDHKTTKSWKWAKTATELTYNPQLLAYAHVLNKLDGVSPITTVGHIQYLTEGPIETAMVTAEVSAHTAETSWNMLATDADEAARLKKELTDIAPTDTVSMLGLANKRACKNYGGCAYANVCPHSHLKGDPTMAKRDTIAPPARAPQTEASAVVEAPEVVEPIAAAPTPTVQASKPQASTAVLYVSCVPENVQTRSLAEFLGELEQEVEAEQKVSYYGLIGFGQGPKHVIAKLIARWAQNPPTGRWYIDAYHPCSGDAVAAFRRFSPNIVRGVR